MIKASLAAVAAAGFSPALMTKTARANETLRVGVFIPLSGPAGLFGPSSQNSTWLAVEEINASGGILGHMIEPVFADVGGGTAEATKAAVELWKGEGIKVFIGQHDSGVRGALTSLFKGEVPYVYTPVYEGGDCSGGTYLLGETPSQQIEPVIPWVASDKGVGKWYLIGNDYNWPRDTNTAAKRYIAASGGSVVGEEYLPFAVDNFDSNLAKIRETGADAVLITLVGGDSVGFNRAFASFGLSDSVLRLGTLIEENTLAGIGAENSANLFSSAGYFSNIDTSEAKMFKDSYVARFGADAAILNSIGESCYEGMMFLRALAERAGSLSAADMDRVADGTTYSGPRGTATMKDRHVSKDIYLAEAVETEFKVIMTFPDVDAGNNCA